VHRCIAVTIITLSLCSCSTRRDSADHTIPSPPASDKVDGRTSNLTVSKDLPFEITHVDTSARMAPPSRPLPSSAGMILIPSGRYIVGNEQPDQYAVGPGEIDLHNFYIDEFEVTNQDYARFAAATAVSAPSVWQDGAYPAEQARFAVTGVTSNEASEFCQSILKRLPTEAEWEAAARGPNGSLYPWGSGPPSVDLDRQPPAAVGAVVENQSATGVHDMVGGVWEWVSGFYSPVAAGAVIRRGGSYGFVRDGAAMRDVVKPIDMKGAAESTGFRCASDDVDSNVQPFQFLHDGVRPSASAANEASTAPIKPGVFDDSFRSAATGWLSSSADWGRVGYATPSHLFVEAFGEQSVIVADAPTGSLESGTTSAELSVEKRDDDREFRFGLLLRASALHRPPLSGAGPDRPAEFYAFVVDPTGGVWQLLHEDAHPLRIVASGKLPARLARVAEQLAVTLAADMNGSDLALSIDGDGVGNYDTHGFHLAGTVGVYVENVSATDTRVHVHRFTVEAR
jgi:formylglycine-generating enzyme required for sulfatase activity